MSKEAIEQRHARMQEEARRLAEIAGVMPERDEEPETEGNGGGKAPDLSPALVDFKALAALEIPERRRHLPFLPERGIIMVHGSRGIGKSMFGLGMASALVTGDPFLRWPVTSPAGVLYVDGEMALDEVRTRAVALMPRPPIAPLYFLTGEMVYHRLQRDLVLTSIGMQAAVGKILDDHPEIRVIFLDNISCLFSGLDEDRKSSWEPIASWVLLLRHRGLSVVLIHHSGKGGQQRGTSGREDALDSVIQLSWPSEYSAQEGCRFELRFTKSRSVKGEEVAPLDVRLEEVNGALTWTYRLLEESKLDQVKRLLADGVDRVSDIAEELGITWGYASKLKRQAESGGPSRERE